MLIRVTLSNKAEKEIKRLGLRKQFEKQKHLFLSNPDHPSLDFKPLKGIVKGLYAFRINRQYRARLVKLDETTYHILVVGDFH